jgi:hypothetical protein
VEYLQRFYRAEGYEDKYLQLGKNGGQKKRGREGDDNGRSQNSRPTKRTKKWKRNPAVDACKVCGKNHKGRCWLLDKEKESNKPNGDKKNSWKDRRNKASYQNKGKESANTVTLTKQELFKLVEKANGVQTSKAHKEPSSDSEESYEASNHIHMMEKGESVWDTDEEVNESSDSKNNNRAASYFYSRRSYNKYHSNRAEATQHLGARRNVSPTLEYPYGVRHLYKGCSRELVGTDEPHCVLSCESRQKG